jgi:hypothetical protein
MAHEWVIEVLGDLRGFAKTNDLPTLAAQLEEALVVAHAEIAGASSTEERAGGDAKNGRRAGAFG